MENKIEENKELEVVEYDEEIEDFFDNLDEDTKVELSDGKGDDDNE